MEINTSGKDQDGASAAAVTTLTAPSVGEKEKVNTGTGIRKRRRGKNNRSVTKPFLRPRLWIAERRRAGKERQRRVRPQRANETGAPYNNNQFLMEFHAPEAEPRTRNSSVSVDSEENYLNSLPEDEEEFLTKEFSTVYEDAACERLAGLSKSELLQEYLALEARYESVSCGAEELRRRLRDREQRVRELELENEKLREQSSVRPEDSSSSSSADSESDSSSTRSSTPSSLITPNRKILINSHSDEINGQIMTDDASGLSPISGSFENNI